MKLYPYLRKYYLLKYRILAKFNGGKTIVHFLHIGKTGGTSIKYALKNIKKPLITDKYVIFANSHRFGLKDTLPGEKIFFFVRDPINRFVSAFYSRKKKDMPRAYIEWRPGEEEAFKIFSKPNDLAMALSDKNEKNRKEAVKAMKNISHLKSLYWNWFTDANLLLSRKKDIILVGSQKFLNQDFQRLKEILDLPESCKLPEDSISMHRNTEDCDKHLDPQAVKNLQEWYKEDYKFLKLLKDEKMTEELK